MSADRASSALAGPLRTLWGVGVVGGLTDGQLLDRFAVGHDDGAELSFQALVERHGPMVLRVCQRVLTDPNDAEDAFQATFLVLLRQAGRIRERGSVAAWLHGVAARIAARAKVEAARRRRIERRGVRPAIEDDNFGEHLDFESLMTDGPGLRGTPRLFLIDREGILRWNGGPEELEKRITDLLDAPRQ
jgi:RNA polymerase sigma factor (sigma-70 family)